MPRLRRIIQRSTHPKARRLELEPLEARAMLSNINLSGGVLTLTCDATSEMIIVQQTPNDPSRVRAGIYDSSGSIASWQDDYLKSAVTQCTVNANSGDDNIRINRPFTFPVAVDGQAGTDLLVVFGTANDDAITAGDAVDTSDPTDAILLTSGGTTYGALSYQVGSTETLVINAGTGNDSAVLFPTKNGTAPVTVLLFNGEAGTDQVTMHGTANADTIDMSGAAAGGWQQMAFPQEPGRYPIGYDSTSVESCSLIAGDGNDVLYSGLAGYTTRRFIGGNGTDIGFLLGSTVTDIATIGDTDYSSTDAIDAISVYTYSGGGQMAPFEYDLATTESIDFFGGGGDDYGTVYPGSLNATTHTRTMFDGGAAYDHLTVNGTSSDDVLRLLASGFDGFWHNLQSGTINVTDIRALIRFSKDTEYVDIEALDGNDRLYADPIGGTGDSRVSFRGGAGSSDYLSVNGTSSGDAFTIGDGTNDQYDLLTFTTGGTGYRELEYDTSTVELVTAAGLGGDDSANMLLSSGVSELSFEGGDGSGDTLSLYGTSGNDYFYGPTSLPGDTYWSRIRFLGSTGDPLSADVRPQVGFSRESTESVNIHGGTGTNVFATTPTLDTSLMYYGGNGTNKLKLTGSSDAETFDYYELSSGRFAHLDVTNVAAAPLALKPLYYVGAVLSIDAGAGNDSFNLLPNYANTGGEAPIEFDGGQGADTVTIAGNDTGNDIVNALSTVGDLADPSKYVSVDGQWQALRFIGFSNSHVPAVFIERDNTESVTFNGLGGSDTFQVGPSEKTIYNFRGGRGNDVLVADYRTGILDIATVQEWAIDHVVSSLNYDQIVVTRTSLLSLPLVYAPVRLLDSNLDDGDSTSNGIDANLQGGDECIDAFYANSWLGAYQFAGGDAFLLDPTDLARLRASGGTISSLATSNVEDVQYVP